jgi:MFS family permease
MSLLQMFVLNAYWAGMSFMWNALHPIVLPALLLNLVPSAKKNTYLGLLTFAGLLIAAIVQPIAGAISDRWTSPFGKRRPLMIVGTLLDCVFLMVLGWSGGLVWVFVGYVGLQISSNIAQGPLQGLLRDLVPSHELGVASSIKVFLDLASLVVASVVAGRLTNASGRGAMPITLVIMALLIVSAAVTIFFTREDPAPAKEASLRTTALGQGTFSIRSHSDYWWLIGDRALFLLGIYGLQAFGQYYIQDALGVADPARKAGDLLALIGAGTVALVILGGWLSDRLGARAMLYLASCTTAAGMLLMVIVTDISGLYAVGAILGAGIGLFLAANWALANRIAPREQAGAFLGLTNLATAGAAALARLEGPAVDLLNAARPGEWIGYKGVFLFGALCILLSVYFLTRIRGAAAHPRDQA